MIAKFEPPGCIDRVTCDSGVVLIAYCTSFFFYLHEIHTFVWLSEYTYIYSYTREWNWKWIKDEWPNRELGSRYTIVDEFQPPSTSDIHSCMHIHIFKAVIWAHYLEIRLRALRAVLRPSRQVDFLSLSLSHSRFVEGGEYHCTVWNMTGWPRLLYYETHSSHSIYMYTWHFDSEYNADGGGERGMETVHRVTLQICARIYIFLSQTCNTIRTNARHFVIRSAVLSGVDLSATMMYLALSPPSFSLSGNTLYVYTMYIDTNLDNILYSICTICLIQTAYILSGRLTWEHCSVEGASHAPAI